MSILAIEESEIGVLTNVPGLTLRLLRGGAEAAEALMASGLLGKSASDESPFDERDLLGIVSAPTGFVVLGYFHGGSAGFVVGQIHGAGRGKIHLFLQRIWTQGKPEWSREAYQFLEEVARALGCDAISGIVPDRIARAISRRYGFRPRGVYVVREIGEGTAT